MTLKLSKQQKINYIAQSYNQPRKYIELTAKYLTDEQLDEYVERAAKYSAAQLVMNMYE